MAEKFDVIIVGAGPGGCSAAYSLAKMGFNVLMVERGKYPGAKNVMGGRMYTYALNRLIPDFWKEAPVERKVTREKLTLLSNKSSVTLDFHDEELLEPPNSFTILRARFDQWFANKAVEAGATLISNIRVDDLLWKDKKITGIVAGTDTIEADIVIAADGAVSLMVEKAGLKEFETKEFAIGMKEIIELPERVIDDRFNLASEEGAAQLFIGQCTRHIPGGAFVYTNKTSLSLGIVVYINQLIESKVEAYELMREFNSNPAIAKLIAGGKIVEYSTHVIPETSRTGLFTDGLLVVGDAAGLIVNSGITLRGMDMAIASGMAAAEAVKIAMGKNDFSKKTLSHYEYLLKNDFVLADMRTFKRSPEFLQNTRLYSLYPELVCKLFHRLAVVKGPKRRLFNELLEETKGTRVQMVWDLIRGLRAL
ncbi:MAG: FAD-dependent oxidoreductase [Planctomycetes bacterium]|uniref:FAD-dependent oxidoreductase n=1 Tax=Candidatus Wunengus californicus TaxID=3367619 RepID=UPI004024E6DC|nr:FAD-dependent oxidoreductase [Planctomycetota bacterium]